MEPLGAHLQSIEESLNRRLGVDPSRPPGDGVEVHQFVFSPTFTPSSTLVLECSAHGTEALLAVAYDGVARDDDAGCWQDIRSVDSVVIEGFLDAAKTLEPWSLSNAKTYSRDGMLSGYRYRTATVDARFYAFNPDSEQHARQMAWLDRGVHLALEVFRSTDAVLYLEGLRRYFDRR